MRFLPSAAKPVAGSRGGRAGGSLNVHNRLQAVLKEMRCGMVQI
jgi:hypothetical protein